jgi:hypothetical protein
MRGGIQNHKNRVVVGPAPVTADHIIVARFGFTQLDRVGVERLGRSGAFSLRKHTMKGKLLVALLALATAEAADYTARHKQSMDQSQEWKDDLKDALDAKAGAKAAELARKLAKSGAQETAYGKRAGQEDALKLAADNLEASRQVELAAKAGQFEQANQAYGRLEATCRACHDLHPEKRPPHRP